MDARETVHFDSSKACLAGTRTDLLGDTGGWLDKRDAGPHENVLWLRGKAGSGKSAVAHTVAKMAQERGFVVATFFCKTDYAYLQDPRKVLPALAYRLAEQLATYRTVLLHAVRSSKDGAGIAHALPVSTQQALLFGEHLMSSMGQISNRPPAVVIDALDELASSERSELIKSLVTLSKSGPQIKIFLTSRDDDAIRAILGKSNSVRSIDINEDRGTTKDIRLYIQQQVKSIVMDPPLSDSEIDRLALQADGLFIWCSTLLKYIADSIDPRADLEPFLDDSINGRDKVLSPLYQLYQKVLESAVKHSEDMDLLRLILAADLVVSENRPLSATAITSFVLDHRLFAGRSSSYVSIIVSRLHAVLYTDSTSRAVRAHHTSFYDFLRSRLMDGTTGWPSMNEVKLQVVRRCLAIMHTKLRFNICQIETPILNVDIPDLSYRIQENIGEELQYSSVYWSRHLSDDFRLDNELKGSILSLISGKKLLFWLEVLSLQGELTEGVIALERVELTFEV